MTPGANRPGARAQLGPPLEHPPSLESVVAAWMADAEVLRRHGQELQADTIVALCAQIERATEDFRTFLSEGDARLRSGRGLTFFRSRFAEWQAAGHAEMRRGVRYYRQLLVPQRQHLTVARMAGLAAGRRAAAGSAGGEHG